MKKYLLMLTLFIAIFIPCVCFANNSERISELTEEYQSQQQIYTEASTNYKNVLEQQGSYWIASGEILNDDGSNIYIYGSLAKSDNIAGGSGNVNIKILNPNRNLITMGAYNCASSVSNVVHHYVGTETGYNGLGAPITVYILSYDWDVNNELDSYEQTAQAAQIRMNEISQQISQLRQEDTINKANKAAEQNGADAYKTGLYYLDKDDTQNAIIWFNKAVQAVEDQKLTSCSAKTAAYYYRALFYHRQGDYTKAADDYMRAVWMDEPQPQDKKAKKARLKTLRDSFRNLGHLHNIPESVNDSVSLQDTYRQYGHVLARMQKYNEAVNIFKMANIEDWDLAYEYILTLEMAGKCDEARRVVSEVECYRSLYGSDGYFKIQERKKELNKFNNHQTPSFKEFLYLTKYKWEPI